LIDMPRFAVLAILLGSTAYGVEPQELYVKQPTWVASMVATRQKVAEVELKDLKLSPWMTSEPLPAQSLADAVVAEDEVDSRSKDHEGRPVLRRHERWNLGDEVGLGNRPRTVRYLYCEIHAGEAMTETARWGCDSPARVWLNGRIVYSREDRRPFKRAEDQFSLPLERGRNTLLVKIFTESGGGRFAFELPAARLDAGALAEFLARKFWEDCPETDWFFQDNPNHEPGTNNFDAHREFGWYFQPGRDTAAEQQMIRRVLAEVEQPRAALGTRLDELIKEAKPVGDPAWLDLYVDACRLRRNERLRLLSAKVPQFVFTKHYTLGGSHYAYTEGQSDAQAERHFRANTALCLAKWDGSQFQVETLLADPNGVIRDPDVSYDGRKVIFAWKKSDQKDDYHLYEMDVATRAVRSITEGSGVADYEPAYLPEGEILFNSTRCVQTVDCWWTEVSNLYRCDRDGHSLRRLTFDQVHDNYPTVTDDGRILYTRWEYNDRGQIYPQPLLQMNPDGTNQTEFYGVNSWFPTTILHARNVPGTQKALAIATGHHSRQTGKLIVIDPAKGRQENSGVQLVAPPRETPAVKVDSYGQEGELFQYPYPLSETECLVTYHPVGWRWGTGYGPRFAVYFMTLDGRRELLAWDPEIPCSQSVPLRPRSIEHVRPSLVDYSKKEGTCYVQDVYAGLGIQGVPRGTIKTLRVISMEFRAAGVGSNGNGGPGGGAMISTPVSIGNGAWDPKVILGDAKVYDDGSAFFRLPARTPFYFQLLDAKGRMVQTMRSWTTIQPGENASCVGCHEHKNTTPLARLPITVAVRTGAEDLKPFYGNPRGFSFRQEIQPILQQKCVGCHGGRQDKKPDLTDRDVVDARAKRRWSQAYLSLTNAHPDDAQAQAGWRGNPDGPVVSWVSAQSAPPMQLPYSAGSNRSQLIELLDKGHEGVKLSAEEFDKLAAWIDLSVPFCGDYTESNTWNAEEQEKYRRYFIKREKLTTEEQGSLPEPAHDRVGAIKNRPAQTALD
jgi:hypothetical protein